MADSTTESLSLSHDEVAAKLEALADELREEGGDIDVEVDNKTISLDPSETFEYEMKVDEHEPMLGDKRESISIDLSWKTEE